MRYWVTLPLLLDEKFVCIKTGAVPIPGTDLALIGGLLILTSQRLYHGPLNTGLLGKLLGKSADAAGAPFGVGEVIEMVTGWASKARAVDLKDIVSVTPVRRVSLRVTTRDGKSRDFGIAASTFTPVWSRKNGHHRDEMVAAIRAATATDRTASDG